MPGVVALNCFGPECQGSIPSCLRRCEHTRLSARIFAVASFAVVLAGCNQHVRSPTASGTLNTDSSVRSGSRTSVPLPDKALLGRLPEPDCKLKTNEAGMDDLQKLDYERQCYRHAEMIARNRLQLLQVGSMRRSESSKRASGA